MQTPQRVFTAIVSFGAMFGAAACSSSDTPMTGVRGDGVTVSCSSESEDVVTCTPEDGDNNCENWQQGGPATVLWPPNHKLLRFTLDDCAAVQDGCDDVGIIYFAPQLAPAAGPYITSITADEAVEVGAGGDGHTASYDVAIIDPVTFELRSERQGGGDGRVYRVHFVDAAGAARACEFLVPHDRGPTSGAVDSGTAVTVAP